VVVGSIDGFLELLTTFSKMGVQYQTCYHLAHFLARSFFDYRVKYAERVIHNRGCIIAMNHQSYLDPPLVAISTTREIHFLARKTLLDLPMIGRILPHLNVVPVDQSRADMSALKSVIKLVLAGHSALIFPEGTRSRDGEFLPSLPGIGLVIAKTLAPVVPMRVFGANIAFPRGGRPRLFSPITVVVGEPIHFTKEETTGDKREVYQRLSDTVMERIQRIDQPDS
jgi:1-acyl-sn-glycerol-3-phosphate acyltransferase